MFPKSVWVIAAGLVLGVPEVHARGPITAPANPLALLGGGSPDALAGSLRGYLVQAMPNPLYEDLRHWGLQRPAAGGLKWRGQPPGNLKNDGHWWKVRVSAVRPADTLVLDLRDVSRPQPGRMLFTAFLALDAQVDYERQNWRAGLRLSSSSVRARLRLRLTLRCEAVARLETRGALPEMVFRLRVLQADAGYEHLVVEHAAGLGGEAAKVLGRLAQNTLRQWRPSLQQELLARANAAIVKAGDTKEVRVSLGKLLGDD
jgi:hypothetical protein